MRLLLAITLLSACATHHDAGVTDDIACTGVNPAFPTFDKTCDTVTDCFIAFHMVSCCGTQAAIGMNVDERDRFAADEDTCESQYPACGCAQGPTQAEDGHSSIDNAQIIVQCTAGQCTTSVP